MSIHYLGFYHSFYFANYLNAIAQLSGSLVIVTYILDNERQEIQDLFVRYFTQHGSLICKI